MFADPVNPHSFTVPESLPSRTRQEIAFFKAIRLFTMAMIVYLFAQVPAFLLFNGDGFLNKNTMIASVIDVAGFTVFLALIVWRYRKLGENPDRVSSYRLIVLTVILLLVASLAQVHIVGSLSSLHLLLIVPVLMVATWLLKTRDTILFIVLGNTALLVLIVAESLGALPYAPLLTNGSPLRAVYLDWRVVVGTLVNYTLVAVAALTITWRLRATFEQEAREKEALIAQLAKHLTRVESLLPICAQCKKIRKEDGTWVAMETYFHQNAIANFSHGYCPQCAAQYLKDI